MLSKPVVHSLRTAGFFILASNLWLATACKVQGNESDLPNGLQVTEGDVNDDLLIACKNYCSQIYGSATDCDPELLDQEQLGCEAFCGVQAKSVPDQCESLILEHYECVVVEDVAYACDDEESSPKPVVLTCSELASIAETCLTGLSSSG